jgi:rifampicin phosphotransferase
MSDPTDAFPIEWLDPSDPDLTWDWDDMHTPFALTPMAADFVGLIGGGFAYGYRRLAVPIEIRLRVWNGYAYFAASVDAPDSEEDAVWARRTEASRAAITETEPYWRESGLPELRGHYDWVAGVPVDAMTGDELAVAWDEAWERMARCWSIHFWIIRGPYQVIEDLADLYESIVPGAAPGEATALIGGTITELHDVERQLETLTALAAAEPLVAERLAIHGTTVAELAALPEAATFLGALDQFLAQHGHLGQGFDDLALASWAEEPELLLTELAKRLEHPPEIDQESRRAGLAARADALADKARAAIGDDPTKLAEFESVLAAARQIGHMTETHNYWIDRHAQSSTRRFAMRVGRRLAAAGVIDAAPDILYLHRAEVPDILRSPVDRRALVADRRATTAHWATIRPPRVVGKERTGADENDRFDGARYDSTGPDELRGTGASSGVVRGRARVTLSQADFGVVQAGDIIVCPSSNPSWVPLFAIAGGLVTDTGGVLSHAAVVAREFALPAVVGTGDATQRIADGRLVEIDGTSGIVRLL